MEACARRSAPPGPFTFAYQNPQACTTYSEVRSCTETAGSTLTPILFITQKQAKYRRSSRASVRASFVSCSLTNFDAQHSRVRRIRKSPTCLHPDNNLHEIPGSLDHESTVCARSLRLWSTCSGVVGVEVAVVAAGKCAISSWREDVDLAVWDCPFINHDLPE
jgi:hypothetical protein